MESTITHLGVLVAPHREVLFHELELLSPFECDSRNPRISNPYELRLLRRRLFTHGSSPAGVLALKASFRSFVQLYTRSGSRIETLAITSHSVKRRSGTKWLISSRITYMKRDLVSDVMREMGRKGGKAGGKKGGKVRMAALSSEERKELARKAVQTRWAKAKRKSKKLHSSEII